MSLVTLPEEILLDIFKDLDLPTIYSLYNTCSRTRNVIQKFRVVKKCQLSHTTLASGHILNTDFFKDISPLIQELNLSAVRNLNKTLLLPAARRLRSLQTLDVGYTNITLCNLLDIYDVCPTIKNVTINFYFNRKSETPQFQKSIILQCQNMFKKFRNIHFIGSQNTLVFSKTPSLVLQEAVNINLQYTIVYCHKVTYNNVAADRSYVPFDKFYLYFSLNSWKYPVTNFLIGSLYLEETNLNACECIYIFRTTTPLTTEYLQVYCSPIFMEFFSKNFDIDAIPLNEYRRSTVHDATFFFWKKDKTNFDSNFFQLLHTRLKRIFPYYFDSTCKEPVPDNYDWYQISCKAPAEDLKPSSSLESPTKKARIGQKTVALDFDENFKNKDKIELSISFHGLKLNSRTLSPTSTFLRKLTYLSLKGRVQYSAEFFNILFRCCDKLEVFDFDAHALSYIKSVARSLPLSKSVKHLRIVAKELDFAFLISSLSQCEMLENVHILDTSQPSYDVTDPLVMFQKCVNLYCFHIYAVMSDNKRTKQLQMLTKAKVKARKPHISVNVINSEHHILENNPFIEVFKLIITKPIDM